MNRKNRPTMANPVWTKNV